MGKKQKTSLSPEPPDDEKVALTPEEIEKFNRLVAPLGISFETDDEPDEEPVESVADVSQSTLLGTRLGDLIRAAWLAARPKDKSVPKNVALTVMATYIGNKRGEHLG